MIKGLMIWNIAVSVILAVSIWAIVFLSVVVNQQAEAISRAAEVSNEHSLVIGQMILTLSEHGIEVWVPEDLK